MICNVIVPYVVPFVQYTLFPLILKHQLISAIAAAASAAFSSLFVMSRMGVNLAFWKQRTMANQTGLRASGGAGGREGVNPILNQRIGSHFQQPPQPAPGSNAAFQGTPQGTPRSFAPSRVATPDSTSASASNSPRVGKPPLVSIPTAPPIGLPVPNWRQTQSNSSNSPDPLPEDMPSEHLQMSARPEMASSSDAAEGDSEDSSDLASSSESLDNQSGTALTEDGGSKTLAYIQAVENSKSPMTRHSHRQIQNILSESMTLRRKASKGNLKDEDKTEAKKKENDCDPVPVSIPQSHTLPRPAEVAGANSNNDLPPTPEESQPKTALPGTPPECSTPSKDIATPPDPETEVAENLEKLPDDSEDCQELTGLQKDLAEAKKKLKETKDAKRQVNAEIEKHGDGIRQLLRHPTMERILKSNSNPAPNASEEVSSEEWK